jgi:hypothetical protein
MVQLLDVHSKKAMKFLFILEHIPIKVGKFLILVFFTRMFIGGPGSSVGIELAMGWTVRESNYGGG